MSSSSEDLSTTDIPIVREFTKVFSRELPRILMNRDIEFSIENILGTHPIFKASYCMALAELKELK